MHLVEFFRVIVESEKPGTFVGVHFSKTTLDNLKAWMDEQGVQQQTAVNDLHTTVVYSKKSKFDWEPKTFDPPLIVDPSTYAIDLFGPDKNIMVLTYECPALAERHMWGRETYDLPWEFDFYHPHVTLSYGGDTDVDKITLPEFSLEITEEYVKDWDPKPVSKSGARMSAET